MKKMIMVAFLAFTVDGCAAITSTINFTREDPVYVESKMKISGQAKVRFGKVQEFRSMLEAIEYRETERTK